MAFSLPIRAGARTVEPAAQEQKSMADKDDLAIHPDDFGQHWGVRFPILPVLPALFKDRLFQLLCLRS
jgi:hypothetical protein